MTQPRFDDAAEDDLALLVTGADEGMRVGLVAVEAGHDAAEGVLGRDDVGRERVGDHFQRGAGDRIVRKGRSGHVLDLGDGPVDGIPAFCLERVSRDQEFLLLGQHDRRKSCLARRSEGVRFRRDVHRSILPWFDNVVGTTKRFCPICST